MSAQPFFQQMEKVEKTREDYQERIRELEAHSPMLEKLGVLKDYSAFLSMLKDFFQNADKEVQAEIIKRLIGKIEVGIDSVRFTIL
jgi:hypothetical protein